MIYHSEHDRNRLKHTHIETGMRNDSREGGRLSTMVALGRYLALLQRTIVGQG